MLVIVLVTVFKIRCFISRNDVELEKIGTLLVMNSMQKNEYSADEFAFNLGYGNSLCAVLDTFGGSTGSKGLWANLASTHLDSYERIGRLQQLGDDYRK